MSAVAVLLIAAGIADTCRLSTRGVWLPATVGPVVVAVCAALGALWHAGDIALPLNHFPPTRLLMITGVVLLQFATGNQLVRLPSLSTWVEAPAP